MCKLVIAIFLVICVIAALSQRGCGAHVENGSIWSIILCSNALSDGAGSFAEAWF
jgi:hypothetical protein